ncbi:MAG: hypothetical protein EBZ59_00835 [Planctomycetia bacterium]|nr:hypothetical protein [Planctomycetia bacterium]
MHSVASRSIVHVLGRWFFLGTIFLLLSLNITNSFLLRSGFCDGSDKTGLVAMMSGTAQRPFVYRSALPKLVNALVNAIDDQTIAAIERVKLVRRYLENKIYAPFFSALPRDQWAGRLPLVYVVVILVVVACIFLSLVTAYLIAWHLTGDFSRSLFSTMLCAVLYPTTFQSGAYYYDFVELFGLLLACYLCLKNRPAWGSVAVFLFSFNKETMFLYPVALACLLDRSGRFRLLWGVVSVALCLAARSVICSGYDSNAGGTVWFNLVDNIGFWLNPLSYVRAYVSVSPVFPNPAIQNPLLAVPLALVFAYGWRASTVNEKWFFASSFVPNALLYVFFGNRDELRAMSLTFPACFIMGTHAIARLNDVFKTDAVPR